ncbi:MAG: hemerythrin domain-containing protein [Chloroflexi bacterium]|nr:hemerythrin domain-containing protein [Chloroflexota bacterium]
MLATEQLVEEHNVIERLLGVLEATATKLDRGGDLPPEVLERELDIVRNFADRCHHGKEEGRLFPAMEQHGIPKQGGPIGVMLAEHDKGREYVRQMGEAAAGYASGDKRAGRSFAAAARGYAQLLSQHIYKENNILYPMANKVLSQDEQQRLMQQFEQIETEEIGEGKHHEYLHEVERLEKQVGTA